MQRMIASIRAVKVGSTVSVLFRQSAGWYTRETINSSSGKVLEIDKYGIMTVDVNAFKQPCTYKPEHFTRILFLDRKELEEELKKQWDAEEERERIKAERREEDGRIDE